jgi:hypothetical protein
VRFLEVNEIAEWLRDHGIDAEVDTWNARIPALAYSYRTMYAAGRKSGREPDIARRAISAAPPWTEAVLRVTLWGVWPSHEDWPEYYRARETFGERRSLETAPGHLFAPNELPTVAKFLTLVMENGWDGDVTFSNGAGGIPMIVRVSHDEWIEIQSSIRISYDPFAA